MSKKTTKRALWMSVLSLFLCFSMLLGTTFAWFTDEVESGVNQIVAGNLDVELYNGLSSSDPKVTAETKLFDDVTLWEPGVVAYENLTVANEGTLALKYQLSVNFTNATTVNGKTLADVLQVAVVEGGFSGSREDAKKLAFEPLKSFVLPGELQAGESEPYGIVIYWQPSDNDNDFNVKDALSIDLGVKLFATQLTAEEDSFGNDYDAAAPYDLPDGVSAEDFGDNVVLVDGVFYATMREALMAVHNATMVVAAAEEDAAVEPVKLYFKPGATVTADAHAHVCTDMVIYGNGATFTSDFEVDTYTNWYGNACDGINENFSLTVYDLNGFSVWGQRNSAHTVNITLENCHGLNRVYINGTSGDNNISVNNCSFVDAACSVYSNANGTVTVTNTTFTNVGEPVNLNHKVAGTQTVTIDGCDFVNCGNLAVDTNLWAAPIRVLSSAADAKSVLTVKNVTFTGEKGAKINGDILLNDNITSTVYGTVEAAIDAPNAVVVSYIGATVNGVATTENPVEKEVAADNVALAGVVQEEGATVYVPAGTYTFPGSFAEGVTLICAEGTVFTGNSKLNINGATVVGATFSNPDGTAADQTINGTFKNCVFEGKNALRWCYAGDTVVFEDCVFSGSTYGVHFDGGANKVVFKNCTFSGFNALAGAIENVTMEGCTFVANGKSSYNGINLWGNAELTNCTFVFDGTAAYEWVDLCNNNKTVTFTNCVVTDGVNETPIAEVVGDYGDGNTIIIDGAKHV